MDVQAVSTGIADSLAGLGIRVYDYGPDAPSSPAAYIYPLDIPEYHATFEGHVTANFAVRLLVQSTASKSGQAQLNGLISPSGVPAALEADETLGGAVSSTMVTGMRGYGIEQLPDGATRFYTAELVLEVFA